MSLRFHIFCENKLLELQISTKIEILLIVILMIYVPHKPFNYRWARNQKNDKNTNRHRSTVKKSQPDLNTTFSSLSGHSTQHRGRKGTQLSLRLIK